MDICINTLKRSNFLDKKYTATELEEFIIVLLFPVQGSYDSITFATALPDSTSLFSNLLLFFCQVHNKFHS